MKKLVLDPILAIHGDSDRSIQTIILFFICKKTPRFGLLFDTQPIFFAILGFVLLAFKCVKLFLAYSVAWKKNPVFQSWLLEDPASKHNFKCKVGHY